MIIGIIAAMEPEINFTISALEDKKEHLISNITFYEGTIGNHKVIVSLSGIGKVNSAINTTLLINNFKPDVIINSGIAGGSKELSTFDFVIADKLTYSDFDCQVFNYEFGQVPQMPLYYFSDSKLKEKLEAYLTSKNISFKNSIVLTADSFRLSASEIKNNVSTSFATEMEGTSIAQTCFKLNTPFLSFRIISDILDSENHIEEYNEFEKKSAQLSSEVIVDFIQTL
jgi:adenosylhomocysteine nucleosidase